MLSNSSPCLLLASVHQESSHPHSQLTAHVMLALTCNRKTRFEPCQQSCVGIYQLGGGGGGPRRGGGDHFKVGWAWRKVRPLGVVGE